MIISSFYDENQFFPNTFWEFAFLSCHISVLCESSLLSTSLCKIRYAKFRYSFGWLVELCLSTRFPYQEIRWNFGILRSGNYLQRKILRGNLNEETHRLKLLHLDFHGEFSLKGNRLLSCLHVKEFLVRNKHNTLRGALIVNNK